MIIIIIVYIRRGTVRVHCILHGGSPIENDVVKTGNLLIQVDSATEKNKCNSFYLIYTVDSQKEVQKSVSKKLRQTARHVRYLTSWPPKSDLTRSLTRRACLQFKSFI